jgi:cell division protein FtsB
MICICFVVIAIMCITRFSNIINQRRRLIAENSSLIAQSSSLSEKLAQISAQEEFGEDSAYIESIARSQLDMVYPGEVIFRVSGDSN